MTDGGARPGQRRDASQPVRNAGSFRIRAARAGEEGRVGALLDESEAWHAALQPGLFRGPLGAGRRLGFGAKNELTLVAELAEAPGSNAGELAGVLRLRVSDGPAQPWMTPACRAHLEELFVRPAHRRRGCARALVDEAAHWAKAAGATQLLLTVWEGNRAAEALYARLGYRRLGQLLGTDL